VAAPTASATAQTASAPTTPTPPASAQTAPEPPTALPQIPRKTLNLARGVFGLVLLLDWGSKFLALTYGHPLYNSGMAFSFAADSPTVPLIMMVVSFLVGVGMLLYLPFAKHLPLTFGLALMGSGALGNSLDRLFNLVLSGKAYVTDFIHYPGLFTGNVADIAVVLGGVLVVYSILGASKS
jgi:signal peptidase II